jgi:phosphate transport system permease protein
VSGEAAAGSVRYKSLFAVGATLFVITLAMNLISARLVRRFRQEYQ